LHSSHNVISGQFPVFRYRVNFDILEQQQQVVITEEDDLVLKENGDPVFIPPYIQGGCFSPRGFLFINNGRAAGHNENHGGIRIFDQYGEFLFRSSRSEEPFKYEYHAGFPRYQEPEGLTYWDLDSQPSGLSAPHIQGQLHAILLNGSAGRDHIWFKHYRCDSIY